MLKKNSWIMALILALSLTVFFAGCVDAEPEEEGGEEVTYTEVELGAFNVWGGQAYQQGWAVGGLKFSGIGDKTETAKDTGLKTEDFQKAKYLVIQMADDTHPKGNLDIIWGGENEDGTDTGIGGWNQNGGVSYKKEGSVITLELAKVLKDYSKFKAATTKKVKIVLQAGGESNKLADLVVSAKLMIPDTPEPFVPVTGLTLSKNSFPYTGDLGLIVDTVTPDDATNQLVIWSIKSWTPAGGTIGDASTLTINNTSAATYASSKAALLAKVDFKPIKLVVTPGKTYVDNSVWPPVNDTSSVPAVTIDWKSDNVIYLPSGSSASVGDKIVVTARIVDGKQDADGEFEIYTQDFTITVADKLPIYFKVNGVAQNTIDYAVADNGDQGSDIWGNNDGNGYTVIYAGGYSNSASFFKVDFGTDTFDDYVGVRLKYTGISGDYNYKSGLRVKAIPGPLPIPSGYGPGKFVAWAAGSTGDISDGSAAAFDAKFGWNNSIATPDQTTNIDLSEVTGKHVVYFWIYFNQNPVSFSLTDIEFYK